MKLVSHGGGDSNLLTTFFIKHKFRLEPGVDRSIEKGIEKAKICAVHLDHAPFQFQISIVSYDFSELEMTSDLKSSDFK